MIGSIKLRYIPNLIDVAFVVGILWVVGRSVALSSFLYSENTLSATLVSSMLSFLLVSKSLKGRGVSFERIFISLTAVVSGIWLYEIVYHYAYISTLSALLENLVTLNINTGLATYFPLPWAIVMVSLPLVGYRHMHLGRLFYLCISLTLTTFAIWIGMGYPQWLYPGSFFVTPSIRISSESTVLYGFILNSVTKLTVIPIPASLFLRKKAASA